MPRSPCRQPGTTTSSSEPEAATAPAEAVTFNLNGAIGGTAGTNVVFSAIRQLRATTRIPSSSWAPPPPTTATPRSRLATADNRINVKAGVANALPATTVLTFDSVAGGGTGRTTQYDLNGNNQTLAGLDNGGTVPTLRNQRVTNTGTARHPDHQQHRRLHLRRRESGSHNHAQITGAIALTKNGTGNFTLAAGAGNTFTGATKILGGILVWVKPPRSRTAPWTRPTA